MTITLDNTKVKYNKIGNWFGAMSYMATKVTKVFVVAKGNKNKRRGSSRRRISEVEGRG